MTEGKVTAKYYVCEYTKSPLVEVIFPGNPSSYSFDLTPDQALQLIGQLSNAIRRRLK